MRNFIKCNLRIARYVQFLWYRCYKWHFVVYLLVPFSWLFLFIVILRRACYRYGIFKVVKLQVPVVVVGNITVGGTGKTPFIIHLAKRLSQFGLNVGIVSRGYGVKKIKKPINICENSTADEVGDEPLLIYRRLNFPVVVCSDRAAAASFLLQHNKCDVLLSDDGLQHYHLGRDVEIVLIDGERKFGNQHFLPAGPLREQLSRVKKADYVIYQGKQGSENCFMQLKPDGFVKVNNLNEHVDLTKFSGKFVHAVAGIGNPDRFFNNLINLGFEIISHTFPDHYRFSREDIYFSDNLPVIMTEKDAVKCQSFADSRHWFLQISVELDKVVEESITGRILKLASPNIS